ncbi:MAG: hypothetical protein ABIJ09_03135 [Pseudomonadota bacterium]
MPNVRISACWPGKPRMVEMRIATVGLLWLHGLACAVPEAFPRIVDAGSADGRVVQDAGIASDADAPADATWLLDAGEPGDAAVLADASSLHDVETAPDTAVLADAAGAADAAALADAGSATDAAVPADVVEPADAAATVDTGSASDLAVPADAGSTPDAFRPDPCLSLSPAPSAQTNNSTIAACLAAGQAILQPGDYALGAGIVVPPGARLLGTAGDRPRIYLEQGATTNFLVSPGGNTEVGHLRLDGLQRVVRTNGAIVSVSSNNNSLHDLEIYNSNGPHPVEGVTGVYFICEHCTGNEVLRVKIHSLSFGAIFRSTLGPADRNAIRESEITNIACDSVSMGGFGTVENTHIHHNGYNCNNGGIPGGGIYVAGNLQGGEILGNTIHDQCGMNIDVDGSANLLVRGNLAYDPGYPFASNYRCVGAPSVTLLDTSASTVEDNVFKNERASNRIGNNVYGDVNVLFGAPGSAAYSDLPAGADTAIALVLARRHNAARSTSGNTLDNNQLVANCSGNCTGLGWFASRSTGLSIMGDWSAATTNYFTRNTPFGSNIGSRRCGANWYAGNSTCTAQQLDEPCNIDDPQHTGSFRNDDGCERWP